MIKNRLIKNKKKWSKVFKSQNTSAYRLYFHDIPEYPFYIDCYNDYVVLYDRRRPGIDDTPKKEGFFQETIDTLLELFELDEDHLIIKQRQGQSRNAKYQRLDRSEKEIVVLERGNKFLANLWDYLDTGLFLDHRPLRKMVEKESQDKKVLNLFSYTCAISTTAAIGGARQVTSIDLSPHYLEWGKRNFELNNIDPEFHEFIQGDILQELPKIKDQSFDLIICDPPTFSNSKKMNDDFDVQDAHPFLIDECLRILRPGGTFYFSTNKRKFKLDNKSSPAEVTHLTVPEDFGNKKIHRCFKF